MRLLPWLQWTRDDDRAACVGTTSYNIGAGMARINVAAAFINANMPRGWGWTVTDDEAIDAAAYINAQPRPDFPEQDS